eukprot:CAMPEP_0183376558 /NCGR_PEP_ID=MMETSP0164_2-20130417/120678_1 /TAXON_ID=221442 /ORGANISM="Coccolithus pelagicus ssp braarudi, Strain PLY182g" /LENGTH=70 /DNA_ID=CAMNT_0025553893 /DNA_START=30 /DNA_END=242 /DNA_ORIENTATION=-
MSGTLSVDTGGGAGDVSSRAFIARAFDGSRTACAVLGTVTFHSGVVLYFHSPTCALVQLGRRPPLFASLD